MAFFLSPTVQYSKPVAFPDELFTFWTASTVINLSMLKVQLKHWVINLTYVHRLRIIALLNLKVCNYSNYFTKNCSVTINCFCKTERWSLRNLMLLKCDTCDGLCLLWHLLQVQQPRLRTPIIPSSKREIYLWSSLQSSTCLKPIVEKRVNSTWYSSLVRSV